jgi:hypothetical protein
VKVETLQYLNKYLFRKKKYNKILKRCSENIRAVESEDCELLF